MSLPQANENTMVKRALHILIIIVAIGFGACAIFLGYVQLGLGEEYRAKAEDNQLRDSEISAERGVIYDRNGKELAKSASAWKIVVNQAENIRIHNENMLMVTKRVYPRIHLDDTFWLQN